MKKVLAKILLSVASGLLFGHQLVAHHHHDQEEIVSFHQEHDHSDTDQLPPHNISHIFSFGQESSVSGLKSVVQSIDWELVTINFSHFQIYFRNKDYVEIRPPLLISGHYNYSSLRAPPSLS